MAALIKRTSKMAMPSSHSLNQKDIPAANNNRKTIGLLNWLTKILKG